MQYKIQKLRLLIVYLGCMGISVLAALSHATSPLAIPVCVAFFVIGSLAACTLWTYPK